MINNKTEDMECYIDYLNAKNGFRKTTKYFATYEEANKFRLEELDGCSMDCIKWV